ncbi:unnamed protein product [Angiostrongylus costaricensis]|uniref:DUF3330 domain-containing protein n=1 Tax=Angiostrongylus costaricensis TaxID=334426 RepID=A0A0R3PZ21_ANGCS|nr:unnamed protein product [Angiostrongylus costaricensis]
MSHNNVKYNNKRVACPVNDVIGSDVVKDVESPEASTMNMCANVCSLAATEKLEENDHATFEWMEFIIVV